MNQENNTKPHAGATDLINAIKRFPVVWDFSQPEYHNMKLKALSWNCICWQIWPKDWAGMSTAQKEEMLGQLKRKWQNIRDHYKKYVNAQPTNRRKYIYYDQLSFLQPLYEGKSPGEEISHEDESSVDESVSEYDEDMIIKEEVKLEEPSFEDPKEVDPAESTEVPMIVSQEEGCMISQKTKNRPQVSVVQEKLRTITQANNNAPRVSLLKINQRMITQETKNAPPIPVAQEDLRILISHETNNAPSTSVAQEEKRIMITHETKHSPSTSVAQEEPCIIITHETNNAPSTSVAQEEKLTITEEPKNAPLKLRAYKSNLIIDPLQINISKDIDREEVDDDDADLHFLKSLLPDMRRLTEIESIDFKIGIMLMIKNIKTQASVYPFP